MSDKSVEMILRIKDELFKKGLSGAEKQLNAFGRKFEAVGQNAGAAFLGLAGTVAGLTKTFADFEASMASVATLVDTNTESMAKMGAEVLDLSKRTPVAIADLTSALYDVRSAGIDAGAAMGVLEQSARLGVAGLATTKEAANVMTSALNAFRSEGMSADEVANIFFKTVKFGKTTISELSQAFGATAPIIQAMGITLADFSAATAALTTVGIPAAQAQHNLRAAMVSLQKPTKEMEAIFKGLSVGSGQELIKTSGGIGEAFKRIQEEAAKSGGNLAKAASSVEGYNAMISISGATNKAYVTTLADMQSGVDALSDAFEKKKNTINGAIQLMVNNLQALSIELGSALAPTIIKLANLVSDLSQKFSSLPEPLKQAIANFLLVSTAITGIVAGFGLLGGAVLKGAAAITGFVNLMRNLPALFAGAQAGAAALGATLGVSSGGLTLIIGGIVVAIAALATAWQKDFMGIQTFTKQVVTFIKIVFQDFIGFIGPSFNALGETIRKWAAGVQVWVGGAFKGLLDMGGSLLNGLAGVVKGFASMIGKAIESWANNQLKAFRLLVDGANWVLSKLGQPTISVDGMLSSIKSATNIAIDYVGSSWSKAGSAIQKTIAKAAQAAQSSAISGTDATSTAAGGGSSGGKTKKAKKVKDTTEKDQMHQLQGIADALTHALNANKFALDEAVNGMGAYAQEGEKLSEQLLKLKNDELSLLAVRSKLSSMSLKGSAEENRIKQLADLNDRIRQNAIDQKTVENDLTRHGAENYKKRIDDWAKLNAMKTQIAQQSSQRQSDFQKKQEDHELENLKRLLSNKKISREEFINQTSAIVETQAQREISLIKTQISTLADKKAAMEAVNGTTSDTLELQGQIEQLEIRIKEIVQGQGVALEGMKATAQSTKTFMEEFMSSMGTLANQFATNFVTSILQGNASIGDSFKALGIQATQALMNGLFKKIGEEFAKTELGGKTMTETLTKGFDAFAKGASKIFSSLWDLVGTVFSGIVSFAVNAFEKMFRSSKSANVGAATTKVGEWAINAAAAVAGIPIVGPALAKAAYASAMGLGMSTVAGMKSASMASFAVGTPDLSSDMVANVHEGEMIIPKSFASAIRAGELSLSGGNGQASSSGTVVQISFEGANFMGLPQDMIDEIERRLIEKRNVLGSALFGGG